MPPVRVVFYKEDDGTVMMSHWLEQQSDFAQDRCIDRLKKLRSRGHELRRPLAAPLRDGIYELRVREQKVRLPMLYFFSGNETVVVTHGLKKKFQANPEANCFNWEPDNE